MDEINGHHKIKECRLCGSEKLDTVLSLEPTPVADDYLPVDKTEEQPLFPLDLAICDECSHVQLLDVVDPDILFGNYTYRSSVSLGLVNHFKESVEEITERYKPAAGSLVVEFGSNDGSMLRFFKEKGLNVLGIDPARAIAEQATASGIETWPEYFNSNLAERIVAEKGRATIITANNVFAHSDYMRDMCKGIHALLADDGVFIFEVAYLKDLVDRMLFDTVYHEHLCYHAVIPLQIFFENHGMELIDVHTIGSKGGSLQVTAQRRGGPHSIQPSVQELIEEEKRVGLDKKETYDRFNDQIAALKNEVIALLDKLQQEGKSLAGYGASATVTTLLYHFGLNKYLKYIVDDNPIKHGTCSPGEHIPVYPSSHLQEDPVDYVIILAWQYAEPIIKNNQEYLNAGGKFIVPAPALQIIEH